jgi:hypothetical protein
MILFDNKLKTARINILLFIFSFCFSVVSANVLQLAEVAD